MTSHPLSSSPRVSFASLCVLAFATPPAPASDSWASPPLPPAQAVCPSIAGQFLPSSAASTPLRACRECARPLRVCARGDQVCARGRRGCVCERVSAWLTKAWGCGEWREGRGGSAAPGDPGCGLQLALARGLKTLPPLLCRLGPGVGRRPLGQERDCLVLCERLREPASSGRG